MFNDIHVKTVPCKTTDSKTGETSKTGEMVACCRLPFAMMLGRVNKKHNKPNSVCELLSTSGSFKPESFKCIQDQGR